MQRRPVGLPFSFHLLDRSFSDGLAGEQPANPEAPKATCVLCVCVCGRVDHGRGHPDRSCLNPAAEQIIYHHPALAAARLHSTVANLWCMEHPSMDCESVIRQALADHVQVNVTLFELDAAVDPKKKNSVLVCFYCRPCSRQLCSCHFHDTY